MAHSSSTIRETGPPNPPNVIRRNLRNALRNNALAHRIDASPSAENAELFSEFLKSALINLETNETIFDAVIPNVPVEEAARLEPLRLANQTALDGVRAIKDADKVGHFRVKELALATHDVAEDDRTVPTDMSHRKREQLHDAPRRSPLSKPSLTPSLRTPLQPRLILLSTLQVLD